MGKIDRITITKTVDGEQVYGGWFDANGAECFVGKTNCLWRTKTRRWVIPVGDTYQYLPDAKARKWMSVEGYRDDYKRCTAEPPKKPNGRPAFDGVKIGLLIPEAHKRWCDSQPGGLSIFIRRLIADSFPAE